MSNEQVYHPDHYNLPGRKECIVEMEEKFGLKATVHFELLNAYKYLYRAGQKEGAERDIEKAKNYYVVAMKLLQKFPSRVHKFRAELLMAQQIEKELEKYVKD